IAHCTQKHILKEIKRSNVISASVDLAQSTGAGAQWLNDDRARQIGQLAYDKLFTTGLSRADEAEADRIGFPLADAAGHRPGELLNFPAARGKLPPTSATTQLTATHPGPAQRLAALRPPVRPPR